MENDSAMPQNARIRDLRFGIERIIEKTKYDECGTFEDVRNRIIRLCYEVLADDKRLELGLTSAPLPPPQARTPPLDLIEWLRNEAKSRIEQAESRRPSSQERNMTAAELKQSKKMAESMFGRKLDLVSTSVKDNVAQCDMQDRIADKLEKQAAQFNEWANALAESAPQEAEQVFSEAYRIASTFPSIPHDREFARFLFDAGWRFRNDKAVLQEAGARDELVIEICRELYDRFMMGGWEPKDAHRWLQELLASRSRMDRNQLAKILWDSEIAEANYRGEKKDYWAQWPEDFEKQPYCRSTLRQAEFIINKLSPWRRNE